MPRMGVNRDGLRSARRRELGTGPVQFIGAANFYLYDKSLKQLNYFYERLIRMQNIMLAIKLTEGITEDKRLEGYSPANHLTLDARLQHGQSTASDQPPKVRRRQRKTEVTPTVG